MQSLLNAPVKILNVTFFLSRCKWTITCILKSYLSLKVEKNTLNLSATITNQQINNKHFIKNKSITKEKTIMETKDLRFRKLYQKILICLLSEDFSVDYFSRNKDIRNIVMDFLQITSPDKQKNNRNKLLTALKNVNLDSVSDMEVLNNAQYKNSKIIEHIFSEHNSYFSDMSLENKKALFILDLCCNSVLKNIFYSDKIVFYLNDFYSLMNLCWIQQINNFVHYYYVL